MTMNQTKWTEADFEQLGWHDCTVHSITFDQDGEWQSDLVLDIDFITEWMCDSVGLCRFKVAPAILRFVSVDDLRLGLSLSFKEPAQIDDVERCELSTKGYRNFRWTIKLHGFAARGENVIQFTATGFTQELTGCPLETNAQSLTRAERDQSRKTSLATR